MLIAFLRDSANENSVIHLFDLYLAVCAVCTELTLIYLLIFVHVLNCLLKCMDLISEVCNGFTQ